MKTSTIAAIVLAAILSCSYLCFIQITGKATAEIPSIGPSEEEQACMRPCVSEGCESDDMECKKKNSERCMQECSAQKPEQTSDEKCVEQCAMQGCGEFDFTCQSKNQERCDKECGMVKEPEARSEEEACIRECVKKIDPTLICQPGEGGEKGSDVCQSCAKQCERLYAGPCLNDEKLTAKKEACKTCEHCYGEPVMGDSGEGYQCIVDVECKDASPEFGDEPGVGPGITETVGNFVSDAATGIVNFFKGLFGIGEPEPASQTE